MEPMYELVGGMPVDLEQALAWYALVAAQGNEPLIEKAAALAAWPVIAYRERQYRLLP